jgi:hypothetical protein
MRLCFCNQNPANGCPGDTHCRLVVVTEGLVLSPLPIRFPFRLMTLHRTNPSAPVSGRSALNPNAAPVFEYIAGSDQFPRTVRR